ncbi:MAG: hypothetical protein J5621_01060 [Paludibacteraceae bacterium]|nr:hypothetical protein [Paludibacteraceae bacterium]
MKKSMLLCAMALFAALNMNAAQGKFIHVDNTTYKNLKPQLAFNQEHQNGEDVTTLLLWTVNTNQYNEFSESSRLLVRFSDDSTARLERVPGSDIKKDKWTTKNGKATMTYYKTITTYKMNMEFTGKLQSGATIVKLRIVYKDNEAKDYEISEGYRQKLREDLLRSYNEATDKNRKSTTDLSDEDF